MRRFVLRFTSQVFLPVLTVLVRTLRSPETVLSSVCVV